MSVSQSIPIQVEGCPFHVDVVDDVDPLKIKILTKGLEAPVVGKEMKFAVCTVGAGNGDLKVWAACVINASGKNVARQENV